VANDELRRYYSSADVVLNDHWADMRAFGIISNRVYDALACGALVVSDRVPGIEEEFDGAVATYGTPEELHALLARYLADPAARAEAGARGRAAVLERHTFALRVDRIVEELMPLALTRPRTMDDAIGATADQ
jgi:spore maturation protein CgeB